MSDEGPRSVVNDLAKHERDWNALKRALVKDGVQYSDIARMDIFEFFGMLEVMKTEKK